MSKSISVSGIAPFYHLNIESENGSAISQNVNLLSQTSREEFEQALIRLRSSTYRRPKFISQNSSRT